MMDKSKILTTPPSRFNSRQLNMGTTDPTQPTKNPGKKKR